MAATRLEIKSFSDSIENLVMTRSMSYMDAFQYYIEHVKGADFESAVKLISPALRAKFTEEAKSLNLLRKTPPKKKKRKRVYGKVPSGAKRKG